MPTYTQKFKFPAGLFTSWRLCQCSAALTKVGHNSPSRGLELDDINLNFLRKYRRLLKTSTQFASLIRGEF